MKIWPMSLTLVTLALATSACPTDPAPEPAKNDAKGSKPTEVAKAEGTKAEVTKAEVAKPAEPPKPAEPAEPAEPLPAVVAEPPPPAATPLAGPLPGVKDKKTPAVVFAAVADRESSEWEVDIVDFSGMDVKKLGKKAEAAMMAEMEGGEEGGDEEGSEKAPPNILETKAGKALIPAGFAVGDPWTLITPKGAEHRTAKGFRAVMMEGSGSLHFLVRLGKAPKGTEKPAVALRGHLPESTKLAVPTPVEPVSVGPDLLDRISSAYAKKNEEPLVREIMEKRPIQQKDVKLYAGRFPGNRTHAAFLFAEVDGDEDPPLSAFLFAKTDGSAETFVVPDVLGTVELLGMLDVDGDGRDEVFYEDGYHEGWYLMMLQWDGDTPRPRTLTGDGI